MDAIERAIRSAFEKGDAEDEAFRERVYRKAHEALERGLQANPGMTVESAIGRRKALQSTIAEIESEFIPALPALDTSPEPETGLDAWPETPFEDRQGSGSAPSVMLDGEPDPRQDSDASASLAGAMRLEAVDARARKKRRPLAILFIAATVLGLAAVAVLWGMQTGLFMSAAERDTSVPNPPATVEGEDFDPDAEAPAVGAGTADAERNWITVFTPEDTSQITAPSDATAEARSDESGSFLRIRSGSSGAAIVFDVGQGVLDQLAGKTATFDVVARAGEGDETQMAIDCNFGELGDCGRKRYAVGYQRADYLFEVAFPATAPGAGGTIAINSDFANQGKAVDIYELKVSVAP